MDLSLLKSTQKQEDKNLQRRSGLSEQLEFTSKNLYSNIEKDKLEEIIESAFKTLEIKKRHSIKYDISAMGDIYGKLGNPKNIHSEILILNGNIISSHIIDSCIPASKIYKDVKDWLFNDLYEFIEELDEYVNLIVLNFNSKTESIVECALAHGYKEELIDKVAKIGKVILLQSKEKYLHKKHDGNFVNIYNITNNYWPHIVAHGLTAEKNDYPSLAIAPDLTSVIRDNGRNVTLNINYTYTPTGNPGFLLQSVINYIDNLSMVVTATCPDNMHKMMNVRQRAHPDDMRNGFICNKRYRLINSSLYSDEEEKRDYEYDVFKNGYKSRIKTKMEIFHADIYSSRKISGSRNSTKKAKLYTKTAA